MKLKKADEVGFCLYLRPVGTSGGERFDRIFTNEERRTLSLEDEGLPEIAGIGYSRYRQSHPSLDLHVHPGTIEIHICLTGFLRFEIDGRSVDVHPGEICLTQPSCRHRLVENAKGHSHFWMLVRLPKSRQDRDWLGLPSDEASHLARALRSIRRNVFAAAPSTIRAFQTLFDDIDSRSLNRLRHLTLHTDAIRILLSIFNDARRKIATFIPTAAREAVKRIAHTPDSDIPSLSRLTRETGLDRNKLTRSFKKLTGLPPRAYALSVRMARARKLLSQSSMPICVISDQLGFSSPAHFASQFRQHSGMTPSRYRAQQH